MLIATRSLLVAFAVLLFLFFFWKKLKDDYSQAQVFTAAFYCLFGLLGGYLVAKFYFPEYIVWLSLIGSNLGLIYGIKRFKMRFFESLEGWIIGLLGVVFVANLNKFIWNIDLINIIDLIVSLLLIIIFFYINKRYKRYVWYRSGKVGFSGLLVAGLYFVFLTSNLIFSGIMDKVKIFEAIFSGILAFVSFLMLYNLSKKES